jgi:hypothetical protein
MLHRVKVFRQSLSEEEDEAVFVEAMRSVRPNYRPVE